jgi:hypothetical protein
MIGNYRNKNRRLVTLSDGSKIHVRSISVGDLASLEELPTRANMGEIQKDPKRAAIYTKAVLLNCVILDAGERVVDKAPEDCSDNEISWREFNSNDVSAILDAVNEKGEAAKAATFPE